MNKQVTKKTSKQKISKKNKSLAKITASKKSEGTDNLQLPKATINPKILTKHGDKRVDNYFWLREKENPKVLDYLKAENTYTKNIMKDTAKLQKNLFTELKGRIKEFDSSVPEKIGDYFYYHKFTKGKNYAIYCRKYKSLQAKEEITLNCNDLAKGQKFFNIAYTIYSPNQQFLAYATDLDGSEKFTIFIKDLQTGKTLAEKIPNTASSFAWSTDNQNFFYCLLNEHQQPNKVFRHKLKENPKKDQLIYHEKDHRFFVSCELSRSQQYIFIQANGNNMSEHYYLDAENPLKKPKCFQVRQPNIEYQLDHSNDHFYVLTNEKAEDFKIVSVPISSMSGENIVVANKTNELIEDFACFKDYLVFKRRENGLQKIKIFNFKTKKISEVKFPEPTYALRESSNSNFLTENFRFSYSSLRTPATIYDYNFKTQKLTPKKQTEIPSGYNPKLYVTERLFATAKDGRKIPISIFYKKNLKKNAKNPLFITGYGSYGHSYPAHFSTLRLSLVNRGFVFAIAHIRGGEDMGRYWYKEGKLLKKKNTFTDFISCTEFLIQKKFTSPEKLFAQGGSAGGMLMGTIANLRPDLYKGIIADVPFVDVLNTMLDPTLPLTPHEYNEWGNPENLKYYKYMKSYSPYDNVKKQKYPNILITAGFNDPRVTYWEPAKWTAKLRALKTDQNLVVLKTNMDFGHQGASGRFEFLKEIAFDYAFIFKILGIKS